MPRRVRFHTRQSLARATARAWLYAVGARRSIRTNLLYSGTMGKAIRRLPRTNVGARSIKMHFVVASTKLFTDTRVWNWRRECAACGVSQMVSIVCIIVHPSRLAREGLKAILANSPFSPVCIASSTDEVPSTIASAGEQVLILMGVRETANLAQALSAAKAGFPDAPVVVIGDSGRCDLVMTALALGAATFIDENVATSALIAKLELVAQGEPVISVVLIKRLLGHAHASEQAVAPLTLDAA